MDIPFPLIYLLPTHMPIEELHNLKDQIPTLTSDIREAQIIIGKISQKRRAILELKSRGLHTEEVLAGEISSIKSKDEFSTEEPPKKRRKVEEIITIDSSTESDDNGSTPSNKCSVNSDGKSYRKPSNHAPHPPRVASSPVRAESLTPSTTLNIDLQAPQQYDSIKVVRLAWFSDSVAAHSLLPLDSYLVYEGRIVEKPREIELVSVQKVVVTTPKAEDILSRARNDAPKSNTAPYRGYIKHERVGEHTKHSQTRPTHLLHQTTSEHDDPAKFPPVPLWLRDTYSCTRPTPLKSPNDPFLCQLKKIKLWRKLTKDEIGVRAYSTAIASIAAYPYALQSPTELRRLPGCEQKYAKLFQEWRDTGHVKEADDIEASEHFQTLNLFYEIWGCAAVTANEFYNKGYKDLDDIVENEWDRLSRVQQIGVKYYNEFQERIPRAEVETIAAKILKHANKLHSGFQMCIVGGYRRGKAESGDVDVVLTHPDEEITANFIDDIVYSLETSDWITHTLIVTHANSERGQTPVSWKGDMKKAGTGFDTLDKALLVWQDPHWATREADLLANPSAKNPNVHRRVDIIISPWKTAGCAIAGWTSGTTFNRDMRRWANKMKHLKFDSSGIRSREDGRWVDLESEGGETMDLGEKERRVFRGLGLEWREPTLRCTG